MRTHGEKGQPSHWPTPTGMATVSIGSEGGPSRPRTLCQRAQRGAGEPAGPGGTAWAVTELSPTEDHRVSVHTFLIS